MFQKQEPPKDFFGDVFSYVRSRKERKYVASGFPSLPSADQETEMTKM